VSNVVRSSQAWSHKVLSQRFPCYSQVTFIQLKRASKQDAEQCMESSIRLEARPSPTAWQIRLTTPGDLGTRPLPPTDGVGRRHFRCSFLRQEPAARLLRAYREPPPTARTQPGHSTHSIQHSRAVKKRSKETGGEALSLGGNGKSRKQLRHIGPQAFFFSLASTACLSYNPRIL